MKKGNFVTVRQTSNYAGQNMAWTEEMTGKASLKKGTILYHFSDTKLNSFKNKETCFFMTDVQTSGYCYILKLKNDITVNSYCNEIRIKLNENDSIQYIGTIKKTIDFDSPKVLTGFGSRRNWEHPVIIEDDRIIL